jgi:23S rRNA (guanosine2251-2'-O)-methyltransferase
MKTHPIYLILHNIRSIYNVGAIFRLADCAGVSKIYLTGITPYPARAEDTRKPWEVADISRKLNKTALGAESSVDWEYRAEISPLIEELKQKGIGVIAAEKTSIASDLYQSTIKFPVAVIFGHETEGIPPSILELADQVVHLPMFGEKESLNVATAAAAFTYELVRRLA